MVEWFFNYSTRRQAIVFLSSLVVLFEGNVLEWGQLFSGEILWRGSNFPVVFLREQFACLIILGGNCPWGNFPRGQLYLGTIVRWVIIWGIIIQEAIIRGTIFLGGNCPRTDLHHPRQKFSTHAIFLTHTTHSKIWQTPRFTTVAIAAPFYQ